MVFAVPIWTHYYAEMPYRCATFPEAACLFPQLVLSLWLGRSVNLNRVDFIIKFLPVLGFKNKISSSEDRAVQRTFACCICDFSNRRNQELLPWIIPQLARNHPLCWH